MTRVDTRALARDVARGLRDAQLFTVGELRLSASEMGSFASDGRWTSIALRRTLLALRIPPGHLTRLRLLADRRGRLVAFDRFLRRYAYWYGVRGGLPRRAFRGLIRGPLVLMYHAIGGRGEPASCYVTTRRRFRLQMAWLKWRRFRVIPLSELVAHLRANRIPPSRSVAITFDDGFADNRVEAFPILKRYGFPATVFVVSTAVGRRAWWPSDAALADRPLLTKWQLEELASSGIEIGAHTRTHPSLTAIPPERQDDEIAGSRRQLEEHAGRPVRAFAYPFGDDSQAVRQCVADAGFDAACCSRSGFVDPATPLFELPRLEVRGDDTLMAFALLLWRGHRQPSTRSSRGLAQATA